MRRHGSRACRELVRHVRGDWRRGRRKSSDQDFIVRALCVLAVVAQEEEKRGTVAEARLRHCQKWLRRAEDARITHTQLFTDIENKYRALVRGEARHRDRR